MKKLVNEEEIIHVAKLMKIELADYKVHIKKVQKMLEYFDILDEANIESEELIVQETDIDKLRDDKHVIYDKKLSGNVCKGSKVELNELRNFCIKLCK